MTIKDFWNKLKTNEETKEVFLGDIKEEFILFFEQEMSCENCPFKGTCTPTDFDSTMPDCSTTLRKKLNW